MKVNILKDNDKNFEEEKIKMFRLGTKKAKGLTKEEQLKLVFNKLFNSL